MAAAAWRMPARVLLVVLAAPLAALGPTVAASVGVGPRWSFNVSAAAELQERIFGGAPSKGWLGGDHVSSFQLSGRRYLWAFGNSITNLSGSGARPEGDAMSTCNYFPARTCAMPTNTFALWEAPSPSDLESTGPRGLDFHISFDKRSGQATSTLWPPGWGGSGHTPKTPECKGCSLWQAPTELFRSKSQCVAAGADDVLKDKGGCCSAMSRCTGYCCHQEFYFKSTTGIATSDGQRVLLLSQMGKESSVMPGKGVTYATYGISVSNAGGGVSPRDWSYSLSRMPDTHVWPWSAANETREFFHAVARARDPSQPDLVYLLGSMDKGRILARANLYDLLDFKWEKLEFWAEGNAWKRYSVGVMPRLKPLWNFQPSEVSLHWDDNLGGWLVPEVDSETRVVLFRVSSEITGPYKTHLVGTLPSNVLNSNLSHWDVRAVKSHPELTSSTCNWVLSMVFYWRSKSTPPPSPGLHYFPRFLCIAGRGGSIKTTTTVTPAPTTSTTTEVATTTTEATPEESSILENPMMDKEPELRAGERECSQRHLQRIEDNMACSDMGDGCHSCRKRAEWIVKHNGITINEAYGIVAADFPQGCGAALRCKPQLAELANLRLNGQAWDARGGLAAALERASNPRVGGSGFAGKAPVLAGTLVAAFAALLALGAFLVRSRLGTGGTRDLSLSAVMTREAGAGSDNALLAEVEGGLSR